MLSRPQDLYGRRVLTPARYHPALITAGIQPMTFEWTSATATTADALDIEIAKLKLGKYDAIVIDSQVVQQYILNDCALHTSGGAVAENNYAFAFRPFGPECESNLSENILCDPLSGLANSIDQELKLARSDQTITSLSKTYLKAFQPESIELLRRSGLTCPKPSDSIGSMSLVFLWILMGIATITGLIIAFVIGQPDSRKSGFSVPTNHIELQAVHNRIDTIDRRLDEISRGIAQLSGTTLSDFK